MMSCSVIKAKTIQWHKPFRSFLSAVFLVLLKTKVMRFLPVLWSVLREGGAGALVVVQSLSHVWLSETPWTAACQASLSFTISRSLLGDSCPLSRWCYLTIFCHPLLLLPSIFPSIRVFPNESALRIRWPKYCSFSFSISPSSEYSGLISFRIDKFDLLAVQQTFKNLL